MIEQELLKRLLETPTPPMIKNLLLILLLFLALVDWWDGVKFQPIRRFLRWIGRQFTKDLADKVEGLKEDIKEVRGDLEEHIKAQDDEMAESLRASILAFASSIERGEAHSRREYENIIRNHERYLELCEKLDKVNGYTEIEFEVIRQEYMSHFHGSVEWLKEREEKND